MQIISFLLCVALLLAASESALACKGLRIGPCKANPLCNWERWGKLRHGRGYRPGYCKIKPRPKMPACKNLRKQACENTPGCKWEPTELVGNGERKRPFCKQDRLIISKQKFKFSGIASSSKTVLTRKAPKDFWPEVESIAKGWKGKQKRSSLSCNKDEVLGASSRTCKVQEIASSSKKVLTHKAPKDFWPEVESIAKGWKGKRKRSSLSWENDEFLGASSRTCKAQEIASTSTNILTHKLPTDNAVWREVESVAEGLKEYLTMGLEIDNPYFEVFYKEIEQRLISAKEFETASSIAADMDQKRKDMNMPIWQYREHLRAIHAARMDNEMDVLDL